MSQPAVAPASSAAFREGGSRAEVIRRYFAAITSGDHGSLRELLAPTAVTSWPQSGETITGAEACIRVYENYPGGPPVLEVERIIGSGDVWVAESAAQYGVEPWFVTSIFEFEGEQIVRIVDSSGPPIAAPEWRKAFVDPKGAD
jgi:hypothetical protein